MDRIDRVSKMEKNLDDANSVIRKLREALDEYSDAQQKIAELKDYYSGDWMQDYEADAAGLLPRELKRGVLSEDAVFDLISDDRELRHELIELAKKLSEEL